MASRFRLSSRLAMIAVLTWAGSSYAQQSQVPGPPSQRLPPSSGTVVSGAAPCVEPQPLASLREYRGPYRKTVGLFTGHLRRKSVHVPHFQSGSAVCNLGTKGKFLLFVRDSSDPGVFLNAGFSAGISQAANQDRAFGQGMGGYGKRLGASYADQASFGFFKEFAYPSILGEDSRYYRLATGSARERFAHAIEHSVVAQRDNGGRMFNFSEWLGTASAISLSNLYHPGNQRGFAPTARGVSFSIASDMGFDVLREFWPDISHRFGLPFLARHAAPALDSNSAIK